MDTPNMEADLKALAQGIADTINDQHEPRDMRFVLIVAQRRPEGVAIAVSANGANNLSAHLTALASEHIQLQLAPRIGEG